MPRFLSRAGTHIDDLERQLARVGSAEDDTPPDAHREHASGHHSDEQDGPADESAALLGTHKREQSLLPYSNRASRSRLLRTGYSAVSISENNNASSNSTGGERTPGPSCQGCGRSTCYGGTGCHDGCGHAAGTNSAMPVDTPSAPLSPPSSPPSPPRKLGTWDGVFMPVMLSIWGILVYVRMGYFLGQIGVIGTIGSFVCGYLVTTMTTLSISAISTNGTVKGGGPYYMLSRSLGPEFGGSIGLMFYAGTLLSGALNAVAFVEPLLSNFGQSGGDIARLFPEGAYWGILYSSVLLLLCTVVCLTGAQMFAKAATALSTLIIASTAMIILSFAFCQPFVDEEKAIHYTSWSMDTLRENLWPELTPISPGRPSETFGSVLGVLFPACIGIMAGASMSSALRKPSKSIPKGTLWAVLITFLLYMTIIVSLGSTTRRITLRENFNVLQEINILPIIVPLGAITTSVTSTLSGVLSSASILQAIAKDDLFAWLKPFKRVDPRENPVPAILITYTLSQLAFFVGDTNAVAPYATVFNLIMFAFVNFACMVLKLAASVNFRPTFHYFKAWTAFLGAGGCFAIMLFVDTTSALISTAVVIILFLYVHYTCPPKPWGDVTQSLIYHQCRKFMLRLDLRKDHVKFWRPQILLLVNNPRSSLNLVRFCNSLKKGGLYVIGHVIRGDFYDRVSEYKQQEAAWMRLIDVLRVKAFLNLTISDSDDAGARSIAFGAGLGGMRPNIVVMGFLNLKHRRTLERSQCRSAVEPSSNNYNSNSNSDFRCTGGCYSDSDSDDEEMALPTDNIKLNAAMTPTAYVRIIENMLTMGKAVGIGHGFSKLRGTTPWDQTTYHDPADVAEEYRRVDKLLKDLRVTAELHVHYLRGSGITAYDEAVEATAAAAAMTEAMEDGGVVIATTSSAGISGGSTLANQQHYNQYPPNTTIRISPSNQKPTRTPEPLGLSASVGRRTIGELTSPGGFNMKVNLPMPLRYEATRIDQRTKSINGASDINGSSTDTSSDSSNESSESETESDILPLSVKKLSLLPRFATISSPTSSSQTNNSSGSKRGAFFWTRNRRSSADPQKSSGHRVRILGDISEESGNKSTALEEGHLKPRRRSDGSMVLSSIYSRALLAKVSESSIQGYNNIDNPTATSEPSVNNGSNNTPCKPTPVVAHDVQASGVSEFNDMSVTVQNRILNEMIRRQSSDSTALVFTTLQAPEPGTSDSDQKALEYLEDIDTLARGLPPVFLVHATSLTITTSL
ncbi:hypothetical protein GGI07_003489 [Coemansia sp. Benny D115]|nr:hypothetical protein GGI07_003489 [Coemansia sp. Benny D115]